MICPICLTLLLKVYFHQDSPVKELPSDHSYPLLVKLYDLRLNSPLKASKSLWWRLPGISVLLPLLFFGHRIDTRHTVHSPGTRTSADFDAIRFTLCYTVWKLITVICSVPKKEKKWSNFTCAACNNNNCRSLSLPGVGILFLFCSTNTTPPKIAS